MNLIVAVDRNYGIGNNNDLLFNIKQDMQYISSMDEMYQKYLEENKNS